MDDRLACPGTPRLVLLAFPTGDAVECSGPDVLVGRNADADLRLPMTDVSRRHCRFVFHDGIWTLVDLNSTNGTFVNDQRVSETDLHPGDHIRIAGFEFEYPACERKRATDALRTTTSLEPLQRRAS